MKDYLKALGIISIIVGPAAGLVIWYEIGRLTLLALAIMVGSIIEGIFILGFAELLERLKEIQKNTESLKPKSKNADKKTKDLRWMNM